MNYLNGLKKNSDNNFNKKLLDIFTDLFTTFMTADPITAAKAIISICEAVGSCSDKILFTKIQRFLQAIRRSDEDRRLFLEKFSKIKSDGTENTNYEKDVRKLIYTLDSLNDDLIIDYFAQLFRAYIHGHIDNNIYFKLVDILRKCTIYELEYIREFTMDRRERKVDFEISILMLNGIFIKDTNESGCTVYALSDLGKVLKQFCLQYDDHEWNESIEPISYSTMTPLPQMEYASDEDVTAMFDH